MTTSLSSRIFDDSDTGAIDPFDLFEEWFAEAVAAEINDPNAMALASVDANGLPDVRTVLMNGRDGRGFVFYTNFQSAKGNELLGQPKGALCFHWKSLRRQVRARGPVAPVSADEADAYFATRPRQSQIGAHASAQSRPLAAKQTLMDRVNELTARYDGRDVPRPAHWSGFRLTALEMEFWQDGAFRLHDRARFVRPAPDSAWTRQRLFP